MKFSLLVPVALFSLCSHLLAAPVIVQYQATVQTNTGSFLGYTVPNGTVVTGSFLFDTSVVDSNTNVNRGWYQHAGTGGFTANFQALNSGNPIGVSITGSGSPEVQVEYFPTLNDTWRYWDGLPDHGTMLVNGVPNGDVDLNFAMSQAVFFASDANVNPWPLAIFPAGTSGTSHTFALSDSNGTILLQISSAATVIPEPGTWAILLPAMLGYWFVRRRMNP